MRSGKPMYKMAPTPGSSTQKRKANKSEHRRTHPPHGKKH